jgi:hypothetical protein
MGGILRRVHRVDLLSSFENLRNVFFKLLKWLFFKYSDGFTFISSDEEILEDMGHDGFMIFQILLIMACNSNEFFTSHEMEEEVRNPTFGVWDVLVTMQTTPRLGSKFDNVREFQ